MLTHRVRFSRTDGTIPSLRLATGRHKIVLERIVAGVVVMDGLHFDSDREILLPERRQASDSHDGISLKCVVKTLLDRVAARAQHEIVIAGHTDAVGGETHNQALSERRAQSVHLYLSGDREGWAELSAAHQEVADLQAVLGWVSRTFGWATHPGNVDDVWGPRTEAALRAFRTRYSASGGPVGQGPPCKADWAAVFDLYDEDLLGLAHLPREELPAARAKFRFGDPAAFGCGERFCTADAQEALADRRVDILLFDPDVYAGPGDPPGEDIYGKGRVRFAPIDVQPAIRTDVVVLRPDGTPADNVVVMLTCPNETAREMRTDGDGRVTIEALEGAAFELRVLEELGLDD